MYRKDQSQPYVPHRPIMYMNALVSSGIDAELTTDRLDMNMLEGFTSLSHGLVSRYV